MRCGVRVLLLVPAFGMALSGCSTTPAYQHPDVAAPDAWRTASDAHSPAWPSTDWWHAFGASELDALIGAARRENLDLAAAVARMREADAQVRVADAALLPSLALESDVSRARDPRTRAGVGSAVSTRTTSTLEQASINASYELDFWGKNRAGVASAKAASMASRYDRDTVELSITAGVATTYFQILALRDRLAVAANNLANAQSILTILRARLDAGVASALDVAQQEAAVATLSASMPPLQTQLRQNIDALGILLGKLPEAIDITAGTLTDIAPPTVTPGIPSELLARRPDIAEAEAQLVGANADIQAARAAFFPSVQLTVQGGVESAALSSLLSSGSTLFTLAASLTQPIFEGGRLEGQYRASQARYDELLQGYRKAVISAFGDVEDSLAATQQTTEQQARQEQAVVAARRAYTISAAQLRAGSIDLLTVLTAQNVLFAAEDALVQVRLARLQATVGLYKALGGGWQTPENMSS